MIVSCRVLTAGDLPNIVILYADDMGVGDVAAANRDSKIPTPHLDRLCREGTRFTDAHSSSGVCTPSRYALLHGRYHWRKFHEIVNSFGQPVLDAERATIPEMLRGRSYATACFGKWHLGWDWEAIRRRDVEPEKRDRAVVYPPAAFDWSRPLPGGPLAHGFDTYFGDDVPNFPPYAWIENDRIVAPPTAELSLVGSPGEGNWECRPGPAVDGWDFHAVMPEITRRAVEWIGHRDRRRPFFLYCAFTAPHAPIVPAADVRGASQAGGYGDFVFQTDAAVGRVLAALEETGALDDTLVIFTADNGPEHYAYERARQFGHRSMGGLRGLKRDLWEGGHRVPFIVRWPKRVPASRIEEGLVSQIDLFRTLAGIVGAETPADSAEDSLDQRACFFGTGPSVRKTLVHNTRPKQYALRRGDWVLIDAPSGAVTGVPPWFDAFDGRPARIGKAAGELYDLREDPGQRHDRYATEPDRVASMTAELRRMVDATAADRSRPGRGTR